MRWSQGKGGGLAINEEDKFFHGTKKGTIPTGIRGGALPKKEFKDQEKQSKRRKGTAAKKAAFLGPAGRKRHGVKTARETKRADLRSFGIAERRLIMKKDAGTKKRSGGLRQTVLLAEKERNFSPTTAGGRFLIRGKIVASKGGESKSPVRLRNKDLDFSIS